MQNHSDPSSFSLRHHAIDAETKAEVSPENGIKQRAYACPDCHGAVVFCKGQVLHPYFRHACDPGNACLRYTRETEEHFVAKHLVCDAVRDRVVSVRRICKGCDQPFSVVINNHEGETRVYTEYGFQYEGRQRYADVAITTVADRKQDEVLLASLEICKTHPTQDDARPEPFYEFAASAVIATMQPILGTTDPVTFDCIRKLDDSKEATAYCSDCINDDPSTKAALAETSSSDAVVVAHKPQVFLRQQGAGNGKTYQIVQLLNPKHAIDFKLGCGIDDPSPIRTLLFLTKTHPGVRAIKDEIGKQHPGCRTYTYGKQTIFEMEFPGTGKVRAIAGTVDSFNHALKDPNKPYFSSNMFVNIMLDLSVGRMRNPKKARYAGSEFPVGSDVLIFVDEAQDLPPEQFHAFLELQKECGFDVLFVGDILQSLSCTTNIMTLWQDDRTLARTNPVFEKHNKVLRFKRKIFAELLNRTVPFATYGLPEVTDVADDADMLDDDAEDEVKAITPCTHFANAYIQPNEDACDSSIKILIKSFVEPLVRTKGYIPSDFWILVPVATNNKFASRLEIALTDFWIRTFANPDTYTPLFCANLEKNEHYWASKLAMKERDPKAYLYCMFHRAEEHHPIELMESIHATRITTILTAKGHGRNGVALVQVDTYIYSRLASHHPNKELSFESYWHVSTSRQMRHFFIGLTAKEYERQGKLYERLSRIEGLMEKGNTIQAVDDKVIEVRTLVPFRIAVKDIAKRHFEQGCNGLEVLRDEYKKHLECNNKTVVVDWGHHVVRAAVLRAHGDRFLLKFLKKDKCQYLYLLLEVVQKATLTRVDTDTKYMDLLKAMYNTRSDNIKNETKTALEIPIRTHDGECNDFQKIGNIFYNFCERVQDKIKLLFEKNVYFEFCPLESVAYAHMISITQHAYKETPTVIEAHRIFTHYYQVYHAAKTHHHHEHYKCLCSDIEPTQQPSEMDTPLHHSLELSIVKHFEAVTKVDAVMDVYMAKLAEWSGDIAEKFTFRVNPDIYLGDQDNVQFSYRGQLFCLAVSQDQRVVVATKMCPQWTSINSAEIFTEFWYAYIILARHYPGARIHLVVIHLGSTEPVVIDTFDALHAAHIDLAENEMKAVALRHYGVYHEVVADYVLHTLASDSSKPLEHICENLSKHKHGFRDIVQYVCDMFDRLRVNNKPNTKKRREIEAKLHDKEWLIASLDEALVEEVDNLLWPEDM